MASFGAESRDKYLKRAVSETTEEYADNWSKGKSSLQTGEQDASVRVGITRVPI